MWGTATLSRATWFDFGRAFDYSGQVCYSFDKFNLGFSRLTQHTSQSYTQRRGR